jgi:murein DD-endopeptidase MepM/ murein hydrolase activator NlpD
MVFAYSTANVAWDHAGRVAARKRDAACIEELTQEISRLESEYAERLVQIATAIYSREHRTLGGYTTPEGVGLTELYESILNSSLTYSDVIQNIGLYFDKRQTYIDSVPSIWPVPYSKHNRVSSVFGWRLSPLTGYSNFHQGIDITAPVNTRILATADGVVVDHYPPPGVYHGVRYRGHPVLGAMIEIDHGSGLSTVYGHMRVTYVETGKVVRRGDVIGLMGNTGNSTGVHLHYEIRVNGESVDPMEFIGF